MDNQLSMHFGEDKRKSILFASKFKRRECINKLSIRYGDIRIKRYSKVKHIGCLLDETISGEAMELDIVNKINNKLKFLHHKNSFWHEDLDACFVMR